MPTGQGPRPRMASLRRAVDRANHQRREDNLSKISIETPKPVAYDSPDHIEPVGTAADNSTSRRFNAKLFRYIPPAEVRLLDVGCSGGGLVKSILDAGGFAVGVEGSDYSQRHKRA